MPKKSMEERVLEARAHERERIGKALAAANGPMPYGQTLSESEQDELWMHVAPKWADPQAFAMLTMPKEQGGAGLTQLAASLVRYPNRRTLYEGAGPSIDDHIEYANTRKKRIEKKQAEQAMAAPPPQPDVPPVPPALGPALPGMVGGQPDGE